MEEAAKVVAGSFCKEGNFSRKEEFLAEDWWTIMKLSWFHLMVFKVLCTDVGNVLEGLMVTHNKCHLQVSSEYTFPPFCADKINRLQRRKEIFHQIHFLLLDANVGSSDGCT